VPTTDDHRQLRAARRLLTERGLRITLCELAVEPFLGLRLGDIVELVRGAAPAKQARRLVWTDAVRATIADQLDDPSMSLETVARTLVVSPRTLQRRLAREGTSWRAEMDAARRERAVDLLRQGTAKNVVAVRVGFSGGRALRRALRRWGQPQVGGSGPQVGTSGPPEACPGLA
jgi:AraC-like DNA-binding protein